MTLLANEDLAHALVGIPIDLLATLASTGTILLTAVLVEKCAIHARRPSPADAWFNVRYTVVVLALMAALRPAAFVLPLMLTRALGAGLIDFNRGVTGWCWAFIAVLVVTDLLEYLFHRAQHEFSFLWKMHEFHHSANHFDVTLTYRHFWLEPLLKTTLLYPLIGIVFKVPAGVAMAVGVIFLVNHHFGHMNIRFSPRRFGLLISHPQYHRLHHSRHESHYNKNFCDLLPVWDLVFGTLLRPRHDEFVDVGLHSGDTPRTLTQALTWPWRHNLQALKTGHASNAQEMPVGKE